MNSIETHLRARMYSSTSRPTSKPDSWDIGHADWFRCVWIEKLEKISQYTQSLQTLNSSCRRLVNRKQWDEAQTPRLTSVYLMVVWLEIILAICRVPWWTAVVTRGIQDHRIEPMHEEQNISIASSILGFRTDISNGSEVICWTGLPRSVFLKKCDSAQR